MYYGSVEGHIRHRSTGVCRAKYILKCFEVRLIKFLGRRLNIEVFSWSVVLGDYTKIRGGTLYFLLLKKKKHLSLICIFE